MAGVRFQPNLKKWLDFDWNQIAQKTNACFTPSNQEMDSEYCVKVEAEADTEINGTHNVTQTSREQIQKVQMCYA